MPSLVAVYLQWKYPPAPCTAPSERNTSPSGTSSPTPDEATGIILDINVIDIYASQQTKLRVHRADTSISPSVDLARHGYIGNSPVNPSYAISIKTLELYRRLRMRKASFSAEAYAKVICDLHSVSLNHSHLLPLLTIIQVLYRRFYHTVLSDTFDIYLAILRAVDKQVAAALGRDTPNWRVLNACPPCTYKVRSNHSIF